MTDEKLIAGRWNDWTDPEGEMTGVIRFITRSDNSVKRSHAICQHNSGGAFYIRYFTEFWKDGNGQYVSFPSMKEACRAINMHIQNEVGEIPPLELPRTPDHTALKVCRDALQAIMDTSGTEPHSIAEHHYRCVAQTALDRTK